MNTTFLKQTSDILNRTIWYKKDIFLNVESKSNGPSPAVTPTAALMLPTPRNNAATPKSTDRIGASETSSSRWLMKPATSPNSIFYSSSESEHESAPLDKGENYKIATLLGLKKSKRYGQHYHRFISIINSKFYLAPEGSGPFIKLLTSLGNSDPPLSDSMICQKLHELYKNTPENILARIKKHDDVRGDNIAKKLYEQIPNFKPRDYLDFACYDGGITCALGKRFNLTRDHIYGVDIIDYPNREQCMIFKKINQFKPREKASHLPFKDASFDIITCSMVLHHIPVEHIPFVISEFQRILRPNGMVILKEHNIDSDRDLFLKYVVDIQHAIYDNVWKDPSNAWEQDSPINYFPESKWSELFKNSGFSVAVAARYRLNNNLKNPFNKFTTIYVKKNIGGSEIINNNQPIYHEFFRKITFDMPRKIYRRRLDEIKNVIHWGQRKLFLTELEFLVMYFKKNPIIPSGKKIIVVYAGAAPGIHSPLLSRMFNTVEFQLYDPAKFSPLLDKWKNIHVHQEYFTDEIAHKWSSDNNPNDIILFISDIRTANPAKMDNVEVEKRVFDDHVAQMRWYQIMKPTMTMLKFRLPWDNNITKYLAGDIYIQPYPPATSTETRLIIDGPNAQIIDYDNKAYEEILFHFNTEQREWEYDNIMKDIPIDEKCGLNNKYDSVAEIYIISEYLRLKLKKVDAKRICKISENITKYIPGRTLLDTQPLKPGHKINIKILKEKGIIPNTAEINRETYDKYVVPNIINYLEEGILKEKY